MGTSEYVPPLGAWGPLSLPVQQDLESPSSLRWPSLLLEAEGTDFSLEKGLGFSQAPYVLQGKGSTDLH